MVIEAFSTNLLDMGLVAWSMEHPQPGGVREYIEVVKRSANTLAPQWPSHMPTGNLCEWGLVIPPAGETWREWTRTLTAMCSRYQLPMPLIITVTNEQRDLLNAALWFVSGPVMLVTHAINQWRSPSHFLDGRAGVWWDSRVVIPVRKFTIPECDSSFKLIESYLRTGGASQSSSSSQSSSYGIGDHVGRLCVQCGAGAVEWDRDAVPYCASCWTKGQVEWIKARHLWIARTAPQTAF